MRGTVRRGIAVVEATAAVACGHFMGPVSGGLSQRFASHTQNELPRQHKLSSSERMLLEGVNSSSILTLKITEVDEGHVHSVGHRLN